MNIICNYLECINLKFNRPIKSYGLSNKRLLLFPLSFFSKYLNTKVPSYTRIFLY